VSVFCGYQELPQSSSIRDELQAASFWAAVAGQPCIKTHAFAWIEPGSREPAQHCSDEIVAICGSWLLRRCQAGVPLP
jgi:hypothetical protein